MSANQYLHRASHRQNDDFYTQLQDIENELRHYKPHFKNKIVYCNCDDPSISNFFKYFSLKFEELGLKKLITTCYRNQERDLFSTHDAEKAICLEYDGFKDGNRMPSLDEIGVRQLERDGDFRSAESIELLKMADVVVTNPPFSLFREYVAQLMEYQKKFLILGNQNAISYKEIFPLVKNKRVWLGVDNGGTKWFEVMPHYTIKTKSRQKIEGGKKYFSMGNIAWFTNLDHAKRHEELILYKQYSPEEYPKYDNYDAIEVNPYTDIPIDYDGVMGVPISFFDKYNPDQFEIIGMDRPIMTELTGRQSRFILDGREKFARIAIRNKRLKS